MSSDNNFEVVPLHEHDSEVEISIKNFNVKPKDEKWQNFPACVLQKDQAESVIKLKNFKVYDDDVYLFGFPRSGTTLQCIAARNDLVDCQRF